MKTLHHLITDDIDDNDYLRIIFDISHSFQREELVIVPRTKGGFSYGYVDSMKQENRCPFNYSYEHNSVFWTIKFYHTDTKTSRKTLPASKIGKLSSVPRKPNGDEGELSPEEYRHVVYDEEAVLQSTTVVCPSINGGLIYCIGVLPKPIKCKCGDHMVDGLIVENGIQEMAFPLSAVGVILTDDLRKRIIIDGANVASFLFIGILSTIILNLPRKSSELNLKALSQSKQLNVKILSEATFFNTNELFHVGESDSLIVSVFFLFFINSPSFNDV
ncbi:hypothetical protein CL6EHI_078750 [Entamoeba histolytica]|uniref:Uncharacterized protein n=1 Tax=Entamoeba histolytica TaxID=5759 RepID=A0A175JR96_ENTHI|nr:hypothetical protein CL6EHI_078750 [Entamoeba histolytica]